MHKTAGDPSAWAVVPKEFQLLGTPGSVLPQVENHHPQLAPSSVVTRKTDTEGGKNTHSQAKLVDSKICVSFCNAWDKVYAWMPLYLHFLSYALAAEVLGFVEVVCSEAAC